MRQPAHACALLLAAALACTDSAGDEASDGDDEAMVEPPPTPAFVDPAVLELSLTTDHDQPLRFVVEGMAPESEAELDGRRLILTGLTGSAAVDDPVLRVGDELHLPLAGALLPGDHELVVLTRFGGQELRSEPAIIHVDPSEPAPLSVSLESATLSDAPAEARLLGHARGADAALAMITGGALRLWLGGPWSGSGQTLTLEGLTAGLDFEARVDLEVTSVADQRWLLVAWAAGEPIDRALVQRWPVADDGTIGPAPGEALTLWALDDEALAAPLGPHEARWISGVAVLGRTALVALTARRDAEVPNPGDRLLASRWLGADLALTDPLLLRGSSGRDLAYPHELLDPRLAEPAQGFAAPTPRLSLLLDGAFAISLAVAQNGLPQIDELEAGPGTVAGAGAWLRAIEGGGFGARHGFALLGADQVRVVGNDLWRGEGWSATVDLPAPPSAAPATAVIAGVPSLLVAHGADLPASIVRSNGEAAFIDTLAALGCDDLEALARDRRPEDPAALDGVSIACLADGQLRMGTLAASNP